MHFTITTPKYHQRQALGRNIRYYVITLNYQMDSRLHGVADQGEKFPSYDFQRGQKFDSLSATLDQDREEQPKLR